MGRRKNTVPKKKITDIIAENEKLLTIKAIQEIDEKKYGGKEEIDVHGFKVMIDKVFKPSKITAIFRDMIKAVEYCNNKDIDLEPTTYLLLLLIKYFTSVDIPDKFEDQIKVMQIMIDNDLFAPIINSFDEGEMIKVRDYIETIVDNSIEQMSLTDKEITEYYKKQAETVEQEQGEQNA